MKLTKTATTSFYALLIMIGLIGIWLLFDTDGPINRRSAIKTTLYWARLAPLPAGAEKISIQTKGIPFSRQFIISFTAPEREAEAWLRSLPGPANRAPRSTAMAFTIT